MSELSTNPIERIRQLEEELADLHNQNISLRFRLRQTENKNADHEKDYLAVWKALEPNHRHPFKQPHETIAEAVARLVKEVAITQVALDHCNNEIKIRNEQIERGIEWRRILDWPPPSSEILWVMDHNGSIERATRDSTKSAHWEYWTVEPPQSHIS